MPTRAVALATVTRGGLPESVHRIHIAVADAAGSLLAAAGDPARVAFLRSSAKPLQALPLVESGAAAAFGLDDRELAIACASHLGMPMHTAAAESLLHKCGLAATDLACGSHAPEDGASAAALQRAGRAPERLHNNCSGKHAGMLATCRRRGWPTAGYLEAAHPLQAEIREVVRTTAGAVPVLGVDGCGVPTFGLPLLAMATAFARLGSGTGLSPARAAAAARLGAAMARHPELISGPGQVNTALLALHGEALLAKGGAEGVWCVGLRRRGAGLGLAVKVEDGAGRAAGPAALAVLVALGLPLAGDASLAAHLRPAVTNTLGAVVGELVVTLPEGFGDGLQGIIAGT